MRRPRDRTRAGEERLPPVERSHRIDVEEFYRLLDGVFIDDTELFNEKLQVKAHPSAHPQSHLRIRHDKVDAFGKLTLRYEGKLRHIGVGARFKGQAVVLMIADAEVPIVTPEGEPLRILTLDPARLYHPQTPGWTSTMS